MICKEPTPYFVAAVYYIPLQYAISLINQGHSKEDASQLTLKRFAYFGKNNNKRLKSFDQNQFNRHLSKFISIPNAILVRKSPKHKRHKR